MKILIATDGSKFSKAAVEKGCELISLQDAEVRIISVAEVITAYASEPFAVSTEYIQETQAAILKQAERFVTEAVEIVRTKCGEDKLCIVTNTKVIVGNPPQVIVEEARDWGADLIIIGSHGYGFWKRVVIGSVSQSVVNHAQCPVLVVHTQESQNGKHK